MLKAKGVNQQKAESDLQTNGCRRGGEQGMGKMGEDERDSSCRMSEPREYKVQREELPMVL